MRDSIKRTLRTALQMGAGETVVQAIDAFHQLSTNQHLALVGLLTLAFTLGLNALEDAGIVPALGK